MTSLISRPRYKDKDGVRMESGVVFYCRILSLIFVFSSLVTPCLASPQPQVSYPSAGPSPPSLIHMVELGFVGLSNNPKRIIAQWQKLGVKLERT